MFAALCPRSVLTSNIVLRAIVAGFDTIACTVRVKGGPVGALKLRVTHIEYVSPGSADTPETASATGGSPNSANLAPYRLTQKGLRPAVFY